MSIERDKTSLLETAERVYQYMIREHSGSPDLLNEFDVNSMAWGMNINDWEWNPGVGVNAISAYYDFCRRREVLDYLIDWIQRNKHKAIKFQHVNKMVPFAIFPDMYRRTGDRYYLDPAVEYGNWILKNSIRTQTGAFQHGGDLTEQIWADTIFMVVLFLARLGRLTEDHAFVQEAAGVNFCCAESKTALALVPTAVTARIHTIAMRASIRAYSTMVAPSSSLKKLISFFIFQSPFVLVFGLLVFSVSCLLF